MKNNYALLVGALLICGHLFSQDFSLMMLPDIQNMTRKPVDKNLYDEMQFIIDNEDSLNVKFVISLGDYTFDGYSAISPLSSWEIAKQSSDMIMDAGIPYAVCMGNHDMDYVPVNELPVPMERFKEYYPVSEFDTLDYFGGYFRNMSNSYYLFTSDSMDFIILSLQNYQESPFDPEVADWANTVLSEHANRRALVVTHMLNPNNEYMTEIIDKNDNVFMAVYGHDCASLGERHWISTSPTGNEVHCIMSNYQCRDNSGNGAILRWYNFKPSLNQIEAFTYNCYTDEYESDASSNFTFEYMMKVPKMPVIYSVNNSPVYPYSEDSVLVEARILDSTGVERARVLWGKASDGYTDTMEMHKEKSNYSAYLPAQDNNDTIYYKVWAIDGDGNDTISHESFYFVQDDRWQLPCPYNPEQKAFKEEVQVIPGRVQAENYNEGCNGFAFIDKDDANQGGVLRTDAVDIELCSDADGGYHVGYVLSGERMNYFVEVEQSDYYNIEMRYSSQANNGKARFRIDGEDIAGVVKLPRTGSLQKWETTVVDSIYIEDGSHELTFVATSDGYNINYFDFVVPQALGVNEQNALWDLQVLNQQELLLSGVQYILQEGVIFNTTGQCVKGFQMGGTDEQVVDISTLPLGVYVVVLGNNTRKFIKH